jgi:prepilin-type N-terminal cleavage/methylation domain-containing protein
MTNRPPNSRHSGFTLLEVVMAMLLMTILIGMVFGIARTSLALGVTVVDTQNEEMLHQAFFELLGQRFSSLPGNTRFDLQVQDTSGQYLSDLTLQKVPLSFTWGGQPRIAKAVQLSTVRRRTGFLSVVLRYYEDEILEGSDALGTSTSTLDNKPFAEIELLEDVAYFEWRVLDGRSMEWQYDWDLQGRLPLQLELTMSFGAGGEEIRHIFWIAPKQNPEVVLRQTLQNAAGQTGTPAVTQPGGQTGNINIPAGGFPGGPNRGGGADRGGGRPGGSGQGGGRPGGSGQGGGRSGGMPNSPRR